MRRRPSTSVTEKQYPVISAQYPERPEIALDRRSVQSVLQLLSRTGTGNWVLVTDLPYFFTGGFFLDVPKPVSTLAPMVPSISLAV